MRVQLKSNGKAFDILKADFDKFSKDQQKNYTILDKSDAPVAVTENTVAKTEKKTEANKAAESDKK